MAVTLKQVQSLGPLQRQYKWNVSFSLNGESDLANLLSKVNVRCISASVPTPRFDNLSASPHGIDIREPGIIHLDGDIDFKIVETTDLISRRIIYSLQQYAMADDDKVQYDIHTAGNSTNIMDLTATLSRLDNSNKVNLKYKCYKCFISGLTDPGFESTTGDVEPGFKLTYNYFKVEFMNVSQQIKELANIVSTTENNQGILV